jgi:hypothetical protein
VFGEQLSEVRAIETGELGRHGLIAIGVGDQRGEVDPREAVGDLLFLLRLWGVHDHHRGEGRVEDAGPTP